MKNINLYALLVISFIFTTIAFSQNHNLHQVKQHKEYTRHFDSRNGWLMLSDSKKEDEAQRILDEFLKKYTNSIKKPYTSSDTFKVAWKRHYDYKAEVILPLNDYAKAIVLDDSGYVYVTGNAGTKKYDSNGKEIWYSGVTGEKMIVDYKGNVFITGDSTVKFDRHGKQLWQTGVSGKDFCIDQDGGVYLTNTVIEDSCIEWGYPPIGDDPVCVASVTFYSYRTIKIDTAGNIAWDVVHGRSGADELWSANAIDVDISNSYLYVTGKPYTLKYNLSGNLVWAKSIEGLDLEIGQNVSFFVGNESRIAKYDSAGILQWADSICSRLVLLDENENVYVLSDSTTRKYSTDGTILWTSNQGGEQLAVDDLGNLYTTGAYLYDYRTIKYDTSGIIQWMVTYDGQSNGEDVAHGVAVDEQGNVYVTGDGSQGPNAYIDYTTVKYDVAGIEQWVKCFGRQLHLEYIQNYLKAMTIDNEANVFVTGSSHGTISVYDMDFATIKYSTSGTEDWVRRFNSSHDWNSEDGANDIATDRNGFIYVTGDSATIKYNSEGDVMWVAPKGGEFIAIDSLGNAILVGTAFDVYVCDTSGSCIYVPDIEITKLTQSGSIDWIVKYNGPGDSTVIRDRPTAVSLDKFGNIYVIGHSGPYFNYDFVTLKYNPHGHLLWSARYDRASKYDYPWALAVDDSANVYVSGRGDSTSGVNPHVGVLLKYNSLGEEQWKRYVLAIDEPRVALDRSGGIYVTGWLAFWVPIMKYDASGNLQWWDTLGSAGYTVRFDPKSIVIDSNANIYVGGDMRQVMSTTRDFFVLKYDSSGTYRGIVTTDGDDNRHDEFTDMKVDRYGNIYLGGRSYLGTRLDPYSPIYTVIKYEQIPTGVHEKIEIPVSYTLAQNYPNPFNPSTTIRYELPRASYVTLKVYNVLGQEVASLVNEKQEAGKHQVIFDGSKLSSGVYYYRLNADAFTQTRKLLLLR